MFSLALLEEISKNLQAEYLQLVANGSDSHCACELIARVLNALQDRRPWPVGMNSANAALFNMPENMFRWVVDLQFMQSPSLSALLRLVFPNTPEAANLPFYTQDQLMRLARALLNQVDRIAHEQQARLLETPVVPFTDNITVLGKRMAEQVEKVLTLDACVTADEITTHTPGTDMWGMLGKVSNLVDTLDARDNVKALGNSLGKVLGAESAPSDKVNFLPVIDAELEEALSFTFGKSSKSTFQNNTTDGDYEFAKALALSQAIANEQDPQYDRDLELALAASMQDM